ncbi:MAG TPA: carotenoid biosynthesis protein [Chloroflexia bacterium]|nr:carotenoid biosynthesis protein [Chloroflexia bacterium]
MQHLNISEKVMLSAFGVYTFVYPFAIFLLSFDLMPFGMEWMSSMLLAMLGVTAAAWLWTNFGARGLVLGVAIFAAGLALEYIGVSTGLPFGPYSYTAVLAPLLPGGMPLAIGFAWVLIVVSGLFTARWSLRSAPAWVTCIVGALLAVGLDFLLEPVTYHVKGYWLWQGSEGYYGVPWTNFLAWLVAALLMNLIVGRILDLIMQVRWGWVPGALYVMNVIMFGIVNLTHRFWWSGLIGLVLLGGLWLMRRALSTHPAPSAPTP